MRASASSLWIVQFVQINGCGRVPLICAFSCEPSVSEVSDWIVNAKRQCSRAHRIESSKLQDRRGERGAKRELIPRFAAAAFIAHESPTAAPAHNKGEQRKPEKHEKCASSAHTQRQNIVEIGTIDGESEGNLANAMPAVLRKITVKHGAAIWS